MPSVFSKFNSIIKDTKLPNLNEIAENDQFQFYGNIEVDATLDTLSNYKKD